MIEIVEHNLYMAILYAMADYGSAGCPQMEIYAEQLYAQMMGWA